MRILGLEKMDYEMVSTSRLVAAMTSRVVRLVAVGTIDFPIGIFFKQSCQPCAKKRRPRQQVLWRKLTRAGEIKRERAGVSGR